MIAKTYDDANYGNADYEICDSSWKQLPGEDYVKCFSLNLPQAQSITVTMKPENFEYKGANTISSYTDGVETWAVPHFNAKAYSGILSAERLVYSIKSLAEQYQEDILQVMLTKYSNYKDKWTPDDTNTMDDEFFTLDLGVAGELQVFRSNMRDSEASVCIFSSYYVDPLNNVYLSDGSIDVRLIDGDNSVGSVIEVIKRRLCCSSEPYSYASYK